VARVGAKAAWLGGGGGLYRPGGRPPRRAGPRNRARVARTQGRARLRLGAARVQRGGGDDVRVPHVSHCGQRRAWLGRKERQATVRWAGKELGLAGLRKEQGQGIKEVLFYF
jgi:hypothetical protein